MKQRLRAAAFGGVIGLALAIARLCISLDASMPSVDALLRFAEWPVEAGLEAYCDLFHRGNIEGAMPIAIPVLVAYWVGLGSLFGAILDLFVRFPRRI